MKDNCVHSNSELKSEIMSPQEKERRYRRIIDQLKELFPKTADPVARMATAAAVLHAKMPGVLWTGWYLLREGVLVVGPYQGPLACVVLPQHVGVCWAGIDRGSAVIVPDVNQFPGHVACDPRSRSEIVVPLRDAGGAVVGVLDLDSKDLGHFEEADREGLEQIAALIHARL